MSDPHTIVRDMKNIPPGAPSAVRVKFLTGFNQGYRHARTGGILPDLQRVQHSLPWQAAYPLGLIAGRVELSQEQLTSKIAEAWAAYHGGHHGTDLTATPGLK